MELSFNRNTDQEHKEKMSPVLISAEWSVGMAFGGQSASFVVRTLMVGQGAPVKITGKSAQGKLLGKVNGKIMGNKFTGELDVPFDIQIGDEIWFEVSFPKNSIDGESNRIPAFPAIEVTEMKWSEAEARRGDVLTLSAKVKGAPEEADAKIVIYEYDQDGSHDLIVDILTKVKLGRIKLLWEYEYHEDTDEIPTEEEMQRYGRSYNPPEYFFTIKINEHELGKSDQDSGLLRFKDWIELKLNDHCGNPMANREYVLHLPDGSTRNGHLDANGRSVEEDIPPGRCKLELSGYAE